MTTIDPGIDLRPLGQADANAAITLYNELTFGPQVTENTDFLRVIAHPGTTIHGAFDGTGLIAMATLHLLPNPTWGGRSYGLIENVIVTKSHRKRGIGKALLTHAVQAAWAANAYKVMLMTGKKRGAADFYRAAGFNSEDKTAMVIRRP